MGGRQGGKRQEEADSGRDVAEAGTDPAPRCGLADGNFGGGWFEIGEGPRFGCVKSSPPFGLRKVPIISDSWS